jgi:hypothetical protein
VPDLLQDSKAWQWAGIDLGEYDTLLLQRSIKILIGKTGATSMRFWGKITGVKADYFVVEATIEGGDADGEEQEEGVEPRGQGIN